jgi:hypothetical protein
MAEEKQIIGKIYSHFKGDGIARSLNEEEVVDTMRLQDGAPYCTVSTSRKYVHNLGNYCSASAEVFCSMPTLLNEEEMEKAYAFVSKFCEDKLKTKIAEMQDAK